MFSKYNKQHRNQPKAHAAQHHLKCYKAYRAFLEVECYAKNLDV